MKKSELTAYSVNEYSLSPTNPPEFKGRIKHCIGVGALLLFSIQPSVSWAQAADYVDCVQCVDNSDIAKDTITSNRIKDGAVNRADIAQNAINSSRIKNGSVKREDIADGAVTINKLSSGAQQALVGPAGPQGADGVVYDGAAEGDMQYWNGNAWIMISAPAEDADSLSFCEGQPTWTQGGCPVVYEIGDVYSLGGVGPAGGLVFYTTDGGLHGLEVAPVDQDDGTGAEWGCYGESVPGTSAFFGEGQANTDIILAHNCQFTPPDGFGDKPHAAAILASNYSLGGFKDWYLPSRGELVHLSERIAILPNSEVSDEYWSSTQYHSDRENGAYYAQIHSQDIYTPGYKSQKKKVRAIRAF